MVYRIHYCCLKWDKRLCFLSLLHPEVSRSVPSIVFFTNRSTTGTRVDIFVFYCCPSGIERWIGSVFLSNCSTAGTSVDIFVFYCRTSGIDRRIDSVFLSNRSTAGTRVDIFVFYCCTSGIERSIDCVLHQSICCWHKGRHICLLMLHKWYRALQRLCELQITLLLAQESTYLSCIKTCWGAFHRSFSLPIDLLLAQGTTYFYSLIVAQVVSSVESFVFSSNRYTAGTRVDIFVSYCCSSGIERYNDCENYKFLYCWHKGWHICLPPLLIKWYWVFLHGIPGTQFFHNGSDYCPFPLRDL